MFGKRINKSFKKLITRFKAIEFYVYESSPYFQVSNMFSLNEDGLYSAINLFGIFGCYFKWTRNADHAGVQISVTLFCFEFSFEIYDIRHWDYDNGTWMPIDETLFTLK
jgi:hypothetical protein